MNGSDYFLFLIGNIYNYFLGDLHAYVHLTKYIVGIYIHHQKLPPQKAKMQAHSETHLSLVDP